MPDIMFYIKTRIDAYDAINPIDDKPFAIPPDLIIEVLSPTDLFSDVEDKIFMDLDNGVKMLWLIDPMHKRASIYTPNSTAVQRFHIEGQLTAPDILPNFALDLAQLWI